jgi:hypothetical protein
MVVVGKGWGMFNGAVRASRTVRLAGGIAVAAGLMAGTIPPAIADSASLQVSLSGPSTLTRGGAPGEFDVVLANKGKVDVKPTVAVAVWGGEDSIPSGCLTAAWSAGGPTKPVTDWSSPGNSEINDIASLGPVTVPAGKTVKVKILVTATLTCPTGSTSTYFGMMNPQVTTPSGGTGTVSYAIVDAPATTAPTSAPSASATAASPTAVMSTSAQTTPPSSPDSVAPAPAAAPSASASASASASSSSNRSLAFGLGAAVVAFGALLAFLILRRRGRA